MGVIGQGPGDLLGPEYIDVDLDGNIYVYEYKNQRISIFKSEGKFINSFRVSGTNDTRFSVSNDNTIIIHENNTDFYISEYSKDGELLKRIGKIEKVNKYKIEQVDIMFSKGWPFKDETGNYYIFFKYRPFVKMYNNNGDFIKEHFIDIPEIQRSFKYLIPPEEHRYFGDPFSDFFLGVYFQNNKFYLLRLVSSGMAPGSDGTVKMLLVSMDTKFNVLKRMLFSKSNREIIVSDDKRLETQLRARMESRFQVCISDKEDIIYYPHRCMGKIEKFIKVK